MKNEDNQVTDVRYFAAVGGRWVEQSSLRGFDPGAIAKPPIHRKASTGKSKHRKGSSHYARCRIRIAERSGVDAEVLAKELGCSADYVHKTRRALAAGESVQR